MIKNKKYDVLYPECKVIFPNELHFPDGEKFWNQDMINMFMYENWVKYDTEEAKQYKEQAMLAMNEYTLRKG